MNDKLHTLTAVCGLDTSGPDLQDLTDVVRVHEDTCPRCQKKLMVQAIHAACHVAKLRSPDDIKGRTDEGRRWLGFFAIAERVRQ